MQVSKSKSASVLEAFASTPCRSRPASSLSGSSSATLVSSTSYQNKRFSHTRSSNSGSIESERAVLSAMGNNNDNDDAMSYTEKDLALKRLNEELERKSHEIFQKIEEYTDRSRKRCITASGEDFDRTNPQKQNDMGSGDTPGKANSSSSSRTSVTYTKSSRSTSSRNKSISEDLDSVSMCGGGGSDADDGMHDASIFPGLDISNASEDTKSVDSKARKRLQRATESVVKCLQSKLISYESRLSDLHIQFRQKIQENTMLEGKIRALEDDRERILKSLSNLQTSAEKSSKAADNARNNLNLKMQAFAALKKDMDMLRREQKQKSGTIQNLQTRLNRVVEENDRLKNQNRSVQMNMRDKHHEDRGQIDELQQRCCQLEQQKSILNATITKQSSLIRTLRNQKSHNHSNEFC